MNRGSCVAPVLLAVCPTVAQTDPFVEDFESFSPGSFPTTPWFDAADRVASPTIPTPTGSVISTTGIDGSPTRAFRINNDRGTSAGLMRTIEESEKHVVAADVRIDEHASSYPFNVWTGAVGLVQDAGLSDFNFGPQAIVFVYQQNWYFFAYNSVGGSGFVNVRLSSELVEQGAWYRVGLEADTGSGLFSVSVERADGSTLAERAIQYPNWNPAFGRFDTLAVFDGEYAPVASGGQFSVDNIRYGVPTPGVPAALLVACTFARRRSRQREAFPSR